MWTGQHQDAFNALKKFLTTVPVLDYPNFTREFLLDTDASLRVLSTVLSQKDEYGKTIAIAFTSRMLRQSECSMDNDSSANLEFCHYSGLSLRYCMTSCLGQNLQLTLIIIHLLILSVVNWLHHK